MNPLLSANAARQNMSRDVTVQEQYLLEQNQSDGDVSRHVRDFEIAFMRGDPTIQLGTDRDKIH